MSFQPGWRMMSTLGTQVPSLANERWHPLATAPVDFAVLQFPGNQFRGEIVPALTRLVENNTIRVIDVLIVARDEDGTTAVIELSDLGDAEYSVWDPIVGDTAGLLAEADALALADAVEPGSSAALLLYENTWAQELADAVINANGRLILSERIPRDVILELEELQAAGADQE